jgi:hypothetical protein
MLLSLGAVVSAFLTVSHVNASPTPLGAVDDSSTAYAVKSFHHVPQKWEKIGAAPSNHILTLQIGLKQGRFDEILQHLNEGKHEKLQAMIILSIPSFRSHCESSFTNKTSV